MRRPFLAWPGWRSLVFAWTLSLVNALWFVLVYGGCDWLTAHRALRVPLALPFERSIPFVPAMVVAYMSIYLLFLAGPFILRERRQFAALIRGLALAILVGGLGFILLPAEAAFDPPTQFGVFAQLYHFADRINLTYNMAPSLHVALSVCCIAAFARHASRIGSLFLWFWALTIAVSTILTHQHQLIDAASGWGLGQFASAVTIGRLESRAAPRGELRPSALQSA